MSNEKTILVELNDDYFIFDKRDPPVKVKAIAHAPHGDWKTQSVCKEFMGMEEGETGDLINVFDNFDGQWCRVRVDGRGHTADVEPKYLVLVKSD
jgi:hypothetical protein